MFTEILAHSGAVISLNESPRGDKLISCGEDGAIFVSKLTKAPWTNISYEDIKLGNGFDVALDTVVGNEGSRIRSIPGVDKIAELPSFRRIELSTQPGTLLQPTVDCFSRPGSVCLVSASPAELDRDYATIRDLESKGLFIF